MKCSTLFDPINSSQCIYRKLIGRHISVHLREFLDCVFERGSHVGSQRLPRTLQCQIPTWKKLFFTKFETYIDYYSANKKLLVSVNLIRQEKKGILPTDTNLID